MQLSTLIKIVVIAAIVVFGVRVWKQHRQAAPAAPSNVAEASCVPAARSASDSWGSGVGRFANPPYDLDAWSAFRGSVEDRIARAERVCSCSQESCARSLYAMRDLRSLVDDMDTAMRNASPPPYNLVQRQEAIDEAINDAQEKLTEGK